FGDGADELVARISAGGAAAWYLTDVRGSVTKVIDGSGAVIDAITYDGFGNILSESSPASGDRYKYTGREWDSVTGLQYSRARWYARAVGGWLAEAPASSAAGDPNLYRYAGNGPTNFTDPSGLKIATGTDEVPAGMLLREAPLTATPPVTEDMDALGRFV